MKTLFTKTFFALALLAASSFSFNANANTYENPLGTVTATQQFTVTQSDFTIKQGKVLCELVDKNDHSQHLAFRMGSIVNTMDNADGTKTLTIDITWRKLQLSWAEIKECY